MLKRGNYLKLIIGPMFSSKSSSLLSEINKYKYITSKILVVNNILDTKRNTIGVLKTHDKGVFPAIMLKELNELKENKSYNDSYNAADIIMIDEGQFYNDLHEFLYKELHDLKNNKRYIVAGLSSDYNMNKIGDITKLVPIADDIVKLSALCVYCNDGTEANFTKLIKKENVKDSLDSSVLVGASELYSPCCRYHFNVI